MTLEERNELIESKIRDRVIAWQNNQIAKRKIMHDRAKQKMEKEFKEHYVEPLQRVREQTFDEYYAIYLQSHDCESDLHELEEHPF